ncbi:MAG: hypothetical protein GX262_00085 [Clostridia bacterium]|nr:hypothetical protein [Clostridia bacterium]
MLTITVRELLLADFFRRSEVLAGEEGLDAKISTIYVVDSPLVYDNVIEGTFALTAGFYLLENEELQVSLVEELAKRKAAVLGVDLWLLKELPEAMKQKADECGLPIISVHDPYSDIVEFITSHIFFKYSREFVNKGAIYVRLLESANQNGLQGVAKNLYQWTGLGTAIIHGQKAHQFPEGFLPDGIIEAQEKWKIDRVDEGSPELYKKNIRQFSWQKYRWYGVELWAENKRDGYIFFWNHDELVDQNNYQLLDLAKTICEIELQKILREKGDYERQKTRFVTELLQEQIEYDKGAAIAGTLGLELPKSARVFYIYLADETEKGFGMEAIDAIEYAFLRNYGKKTLTAFYDQGIFLLVPSDLAGEEEIATMVWKALTKVISQKFYIGVGRIVTYPDYGVSYRDTKKAIKIGPKIKNRRQQNIYFFDKLGIYRFLSPENITKDAVAFYNDYLKPLEEYDRKNNSELVTTLEAFLQTGCNWNLTAAKLYLHPNTIRYRIGLIEKMSKVDFKIEEDRFNMSLALKLAPILPKDDGPAV